MLGFGKRRDDWTEGTDIREFLVASGIEVHCFAKVSTAELLVSSIEIDVTE
jgi:hypothetical protein